MLGGVLVSHAVAGELNATLQELKERHFGTAAVEVKSNWLRRPRERRRRYLAPFNLTEEDLVGFVDEYYATLVEAEFQLIAAVVDKVHMQDDYPRPWYPPAAAYEMMIQRAQMAMEEAGGYFSVEIDIMSGATPKGRDYSDNLQSQHARMRARGSSLIRGMAFDRLIGNLRLVDSAHAELVQVADIVAYNVFRQFTDHGEKWETAKAARDAPHVLPTYEYFRRPLPKFRTGPRGRLQGYGVAKMPMHERVQWSVRDEEERQGAP